jgi:DNA-binding NarL/FixJ family response regulator
LDLEGGIAVAADGASCPDGQPSGKRGLMVVPPSSAIEADCRKKGWDLPLVGEAAADDCNRARRLTARQFEILRALKRGASNKEIARNLGILESTVKVHLKSIYRQLHVRNRTQAAIVSAQYDT